MGKVRRWWSWWSRGFYDQVQDQTDASTLVEYEDACEQFGPDSVEAQRLQPQAAAARARRDSGPTEPTPAPG